MVEINALWNNLLDASGLSDLVIFVLGTSLTNITVIWGLYFLTLYCVRNKFFWKYRIQPNATIDPELERKTIHQLLINEFVGLPILASLLFPVFRFCGMSIRGPIPAIKIFARDFVVSLLITDTLGYWSHRMLHHPAIYKHVHKLHHEYKSNNSISANFAHPVEDIINVLSVFAGPWLLGSHFLVILFWVTIRQMEASSAHMGYQFSNWSIFSSAAFHEYHHSHNIGTYGAFFTFWDHLMGTDRSFLEYQKKQTKSH